MPTKEQLDAAKEIGNNLSNPHAVRSPSIKSIEISYHELLTIRTRVQELEKENQQLKADCAVKDEVLRLISKDWDKHGTSISNYSDGEYTQDYTTRRESVNKALLTNPGAQLLEELERLQNLKTEVDNIEADGRPHGSDWQHNPCECDHCALWDRIKTASIASDKPKQP